MRRLPGDPADGLVALLPNLRVRVFCCVEQVQGERADHWSTFPFDPGVAKELITAEAVFHPFHQAANARVVQPK